MVFKTQQSREIWLRCNKVQSKIVNCDPWTAFKNTVSLPKRRWESWRNGFAFSGLTRFIRRIYPENS
jgi:hypothetical protein